MPGVVLAGPGVDEPSCVVAELAEGARGQDHSETRLAEVDLSGRVTTKMFGHRRLQCCDLLVEGGDEGNLGADDGGVGALGRRELT